MSIPKPFSPCNALQILLCLWFLSFSPRHLVHAASSSDALCDKTPHPDFCRSQEPKNQSTSVNEFGRLSIQKSLSTSSALLNTFNRYLSSGQFISSQTLTRALRDCQFLLSLNVEMLSDVAQTLASTDSLQSTLQYHDLVTQLSATITNMDTCLDGLTSSSSSSPEMAKAISPSISNGTMLCSISLALFKNGWAPPASTGRSLSERSRRIQRKLLQGGGGVNIVKTVVVNPDGTGDYTTINESITAAPNSTKAGNGYYQIRVVAGVYEEYISIPSNKKYIMIIGDGLNKTIITGSRSVGDGYTTFDSATFVVVAEGFVGVNLTIRNTAGPEKHQAVALRNGADLSAFYSCIFEGYQDTLYTHSKRQFYRDCDIYGTVDYIFGNAAVVLQNCNMYSRLPLSGQFNAITAQGKTDINQNTGISIHDCNIKAADDLVPSINSTNSYLGRPWKTYSTTVFMESVMDSLIDPAGWVAWSGNQSLDTLYYAEYANSGPGSSTSNRVDWSGYHVITDGADVLKFTVSQFISGDAWLPSTGVPYTGGFL